MSSYTIAQMENACATGNIAVIRNATDVYWERYNKDKKSFMDIALENKQYDVAIELIKKKCYAHKINTQDSESELSKRILNDPNLDNNETLTDVQTTIIEVKAANLRQSKTTTIEELDNFINKYSSLKLWGGITVVNYLLHFYCNEREKEKSSNSIVILKKITTLVSNKLSDFDIISHLVNKYKPDLNVVLDEKTLLMSVYERLCCLQQQNSHYYGQQNKQQNLWKIIDLLLKNGADINKSVEKTTNTVLTQTIMFQFADENRDLDSVITHLLRNRADIDQCKLTIKNATNLFQTKWFIKHNLYVRDDIINLLHDACRNGKSDVYFLLMSSNILTREEICTENFNNSETSLLFITCDCVADNVVIAKNLIEVYNLSPITYYTSKKITSFDCAIMREHIEIIKYFVQLKGVTITKKHIYDSLKDNEILAILIKKHIEVSGDQLIESENTSLYGSIVNRMTNVSNQLTEDKRNDKYARIKYIHKNKETLNMLFENMFLEQYSKSIGMVFGYGLAPLPVLLKRQVDFNGDLLLEVCKCGYVGFKLDKKFPYIDTLHFMLEHIPYSSTVTQSTTLLHELCKVIRYKNKKSRDFLNSTAKLIECIITEHENVNINQLDSQSKTPIEYLYFDDHEIIVNLFKREGATKHPESRGCVIM